MGQAGMIEMYHSQWHCDRFLGDRSEADGQLSERELEQRLAYFLVHKGMAQHCKACVLMILYHISILVQTGRE